MNLCLGLVNAQSYTSGLMLERAGQLEQAFEEYRLAANRNPRDQPAYAGLVRLAEPLNRYDTVVAVSRRLLKLAPDQPEYALGLVTGLLATKKHSLARAEATRAKEKWPDRAQALGDVFARGQDYPTAIEFYTQARKQGGNSLSLGEKLMAAYEAAGQPVPAVRELVSILNDHQGTWDRFRPRLAVLAGQGKAAVLAELEKVKSPVLRARTQAVVALALGKETEAMRVLRPVLSQQELTQFAHECETQGHLGAALAVYQQQKAHADAARVLRLMGRYKEAQAELAMDSGTGAQFELGELYRDQGDLQRAAESYQRVLARQPNHEPAAFGLASALLGSGRTGPARAAARGKSESVLSSDRLLYLVARTYFYEGQFESTGAYVAELAQKFPQSRLVNDALELALLAGSGNRAKELARLLLDYETGAGDMASAQSLAEGNDQAAEQAHFLLARLLRRERKPKEALTILDKYRQRFATGSLAPRARLEQAYIYLDDLKDESKYRESLQQLVVEYPGSAYVPIARNFLAQAAKPVAPEVVR